MSTMKLSPVKGAEYTPLTRWEAGPCVFSGKRASLKTVMMDQDCNLVMVKVSGWYKDIPENQVLCVQYSESIIRIISKPVISVTSSQISQVNKQINKQNQDIFTVPVISRAPSLPSLTNSSLINISEQEFKEWLGYTFAHLKYIMYTNPGYKPDNSFNPPTHSN